MRFAHAFLFASVLTLSPAGTAADDPVPTDSLYNTVGLSLLLLENKNAKAELKLTKDQEKFLREDKGFNAFDDSDELFKVQGPNKEAKVRAIYTKTSEKFFAWLGKTLKPDQIKRLKQIGVQQKGVWAFDHPEVRTAVGVDAAQAKKLRAAYDKLRERHERELVAKPNTDKQTRDSARPYAGGVAPGRGGAEASPIYPKPGIGVNICSVARDGTPVAAI